MRIKQTCKPRAFTSSPPSRGKARPAEDGVFVRLAHRSLCASARQGNCSRLFAAVIFRSHTCMNLFGFGETAGVERNEQMFYNKTSHELRNHFYRPTVPMLSVCRDVLLPTGGVSQCQTIHPNGEPAVSSFLSRYNQTLNSN